MNSSPGAKRKFAWKILLKCKNTIDTHVPFLLQPGAEIPFRSHGLFEDFSARLAENPTPVSETGLEFSSWAEILPVMKPSPCNCHFDFKRFSFRTRAEICHVIKP